MEVVSFTLRFFASREMPTDPEWPKRKLFSLSEIKPRQFSHAGHRWSGIMGKSLQLGHLRIGLCSCIFSDYDFFQLLFMAICLKQEANWRIILINLIKLIAGWRCLRKLFLFTATIIRNLFPKHGRTHTVMARSDILFGARRPSQSNVIISERAGSDDETGKQTTSRSGYLVNPRRISTLQWHSMHDTAEPGKKYEVHGWRQIIWLMWRTLQRASLTESV